jgi:hypothetical protein
MKILTVLEDLASPELDHTGFNNDQRFSNNKAFWPDAGNICAFLH